MFSNEANTQCDSILKHLKSGKSITPIEALNLFCCFRLGARIYDLRQQGYDIQTKTVKKGNKSFAEYVMQ